MIVANVSFGRVGKHSAAEMENLAEIYIGWLILSGQLGGEYLLAWNKGCLNAYVQMTGPAAIALPYHSDLARLELDRFRQEFRREPVWKILDDHAPQKESQWKRAPFLYIYTHALDWSPPVCRGDNGRFVPTYLLPISDQIKKSLHFWQRGYRQHDDIWLHAGALEVQCYRQVADPQSRLSSTGREICRAIETNTGIPTYYYLARYWGRETGEETRKCPGCGGNWHRRAKRGMRPKFHHFDFQCNRCRLVSHVASTFDNQRLAKIGEFRGQAA